MSYFQEISFFHDCGHTELRFWLDPLAYRPPPRTTRRILPGIVFVFVNDLDESYTEETTEVHYQQRFCSSCQGKTIEQPNQAEVEALNEIRALWHEIVSSFRVQFDNLDQMVEQAADDRNTLVTEQAQLQRRLEELQQLNEERPRCNAPSFREVFGDTIFLETMDAAETNAEIKREMIQYEVYHQEGKVQNRLEEVAEEIAYLELEISQAMVEKNYFLAFKELRKLQEVNGVPLREQTHMLASSWSNSLLTTETAPPPSEDGTSKEEENCSICFSDLYSDRCRSLPCGHLWHGDCITQWFEAHDTCPMCRAPYKILRSPPWDNEAQVDAAIATLGEEIRTLSTT
jgi:chaperonin cofactor prefoldin